MTGDHFESNDKTAPREGHPGSKGPEETANGLPREDGAGGAGADDEFLLELGDLEDAAAQQPQPEIQQADDEFGLDGLFDRPALSASDDVDANSEDDALFNASGHLGGKGTAFRGAKPAPEFVEDHAGWLGDDIDMAAMLGETRPQSSSRSSDRFSSGFEDESAAELDPFDVGEIEVENLDELDRGDVPTPSEEEDGNFVLFDAQDEAEMEQAIAPGLKFVVDPRKDTTDVESEEDFEVQSTTSFDRLSTSGALDEDWAPLAATPLGGPLLSHDDDEQASEDPRSGFESNFGTGSRAFDLDLSDEDATSETAITPQWSGTDFALDSAADSDSAGNADLGASFENYEDSEQPIEEQDPIYGDLAASGDPESLGYERWDDSEEVAAQRQAEFEEVAGIAEEAEFAPPPLRVVGAPTRRGLIVKRLAAAAAVLLVVGLTALGVFPEWFGMGGEPTSVDRIEIARPKIDVSLPPPVVEEPQDPSTEPSEPTTPTDPTDVQPPPVGNTPPDIELPVIPDPPILTEPVVPVPPVVVVGEPKAPEPVRKPNAEPDFSPLPVGEFLEILGPTRAAAVSTEGTIAIGTKALALLRNDEIFVGVVRSMDADRVTLDLQPGEVHIALASLSRIASLDEATSDESMEAEHGFVRLQNETRFFGRILRDPESGALIVQSEQSRIVLPRREVVEFGASGASNTQVLLEGDNAWLEQRVREQLQNLGGRQPAIRAPDTLRESEFTGTPSAPSRSR
ncbi:MAG: hypothetical protein AB7I19_08805 [Planctomycetota bacterium]